METLKVNTDTHYKIKILNPIDKQPLLETAKGLENARGELVYPMINGSYRIEEGENYTDNFGFEWNIFQQTQLDSYSGTNISKKRFFASTGWGRSMEGENILEVAPDGRPGFCGDKPIRAAHCSSSARKW